MIRRENTKTRKAVFRACVLSWLFLIVAGLGRAQERRRAPAGPTRLAVLLADDHRGASPRDLAVLRSGTRSRDAPTVRAAVRALGRLERPALIPDITPALRHVLPEIRAEAADAIGQSAQGWKRDGPGSRAGLDAAVAVLTNRLRVEAEPDVRAAISESLGRMPFTIVAQVEAAERTLLDLAARTTSLPDRLGVAKGFEAFVRINRNLRAPGDEAIGLLRRLVPPAPGEAATGARVRRLALEALISAAAANEDGLRAATRDPDAQVRRIAMRAAVTGPPSAAGDAAVDAGLDDTSALVRLEALRAVWSSADKPKAGASERACAASASAVRDQIANVALTALDQLSACGSWPDAVAILVRTVDDLSEAAAPRGWHRAAHAIVALATAAPDRAAAALAQFTSSGIWQVRMYAARAATGAKQRAALEKLARDDDDNVREAAVEGLRTVARHDADTFYVDGLGRRGHQIVHASAVALDGTPHPDQAVPALRAAWQRLVAEGRDNSHDARNAIAKTLTGLGVRVSAEGRLVPARAPQTDLNAEDLRRLASPRARVTMRGIGVFELALVTAQAPAAVLRFAHLAESGYYNGLTFHRVVPNFVIQGGSPGANELIGAAAFMRDELGLWPHVRGAVGISTRGRDTGDAQIFIDLVDNPRLDHEYTVFAQVLNGMDVVDQILEGDVIEKIEIVTGR